MLPSANIQYNTIICNNYIFLPKFHITSVSVCKETYRFPSSCLQETASQFQLQVFLPDHSAPVGGKPSLQTIKNTPLTFYLNHMCFRSWVLTLNKIYAQFKGSCICKGHFSRHLPLAKKKDTKGKGKIPYTEGIIPKGRSQKHLLFLDLHQRLSLKTSPQNHTYLFL